MRLKFRIVDGTEMRIIGKLIIPMTISRPISTQTFYVFKKLNQSVILGCDFLNEQKAWIDFGNDVLEIQRCLVVTRMFASPHKSSLARLVNRISIPTQSVTVAKIKVQNQISDNLSVIEPIWTLPNTNTRMIAKTENGTSCRQIFNPNDVWKHTEQNEPVVRVESIDRVRIENESEMNERKIDGEAVLSCSENESLKQTKFIYIYRHNKIYRYGLNKC